MARKTPDILVETPEPINRFPDFVRHLVCRLKVLCPTLGKKRIAETLARAGLHLGISTVGRMLKECGSKRPKIEATAIDGKSVGEGGGGKPVQARGPNHIWQVDLSAPWRHFFPGGVCWGLTGG